MSRFMSKVVEVDPYGNQPKHFMECHEYDAKNVTALDNGRQSGVPNGTILTKDNSEEDKVKYYGPCSRYNFNKAN